MDVILEVLRSLNEPNGIELLGNGKLSAALIQLNSPINCKCNVDYSVAKTSIEAIARWLNNPSTRSKLFALNILSWFTSSIIFNPQSSNSFIRQQLEQCVRLAYALINSESHDLSLMSLFVISTCELLWHKVGEDSTAQTGLLAALNSADSTQQYWAYRAVVNETKLHGSSHLLQTPGASDRLTSCIKTILECLSDGERRKMLLTQSYPQTGQESFLPLQLDLLLLIPIGKGLSSPLRAIVDICPAVSAAMCDLLKKSGAPDDTVEGCYRVWKLLVRTLAVLLRESAPIAAAGAEEVSSVGTTETERKEMFMNLLAPRNGVGVLAAPLQFVLKRSKLHAARCYHDLAVALTSGAENWHEPPAVLKLLLRCLHHLLLSTSFIAAESAGNSSSSSSNAPGSSRKRKRLLDPVATVADTSRIGAEGDATILDEAATESALSGGLISSSLDAMEAGLEVLTAAGGALLVLCASINRSNRAAVLNVSVSMGRSTQSGPKQALSSTATTTAATAIAAPAEVAAVDRTSLDVILRGMLDSCTAVPHIDEERGFGVDLTTLVAVHKVYIAAMGIAHLHGNRNLSSHIGIATDTSAGEGTTSSIFAGGLFSSPARVRARIGNAPRIEETIGATAVKAPKNENENDAISCARVFQDLGQIQNAFFATSSAHSSEERIKQRHVDTTHRLSSRADAAAHSLTALTQAWQSCTVALAQALFAELAPFEVNTSPGRNGQSVNNSAAATGRGGAGAVSSGIAPQYQATPADGHTQRSQHVLFGSAYPGSGTSRAAPCLFAFPSQMSQPFPARNRGAPAKQSPGAASAEVAHKHQERISPGSVLHPLLPSEDAYAMSQVVLCSSHPPAIQAAMDLCGAVIKVWVDIWLSTPLGHREHTSRGLMVEALWWFLHRTSAFAVEVRAEDLAMLHGAMQTLQPALCPSACPDNAAGLVVLLALSHASLCETASLPQQDPEGEVEMEKEDERNKEEYGEGRKRRECGSVDALERALHSCMNSMTESGVLPGLFEWMPHVLAHLHISSDNNSNLAGRMLPAVDTRGSSSSSVREVIITLSSAATALVPVASADGPMYDACHRIAGRFIAHSLQQLSGMTLPSASEQHSPGLMHSMIGGLGHLLIAPVVMAVLTQRGLISVFAEVLLLQGNAEPTRPALENWQKILLVWLELKEFARSHGIEESIHCESEEAEISPSSSSWVEALLRMETQALSGVPLQVIPAHYAVGSRRVNDAFSRLDWVLRLASAAVDAVILHRRKYPHSELTDTLAGAASALVAATASSLGGAIMQVSALVDEDVSTTLKEVDALVTKILALFPVSVGLLTGPLCSRIKFARCSSGNGEQSENELKAQHRGYAGTVFSSLLQLVANLRILSSTSSAGEPYTARFTAVLKRYEQQWLLATLSALCATHTRGHASAQHRGAFRSAAATLAVGEEHREVVREFARRLRGSGGLQSVDTDTAEMLNTAWAELGGIAGELQRILEDRSAVQSSDVRVPQQNQLSLAMTLQPTETTRQQQQMAPTSGQKRSFIPPPAAPAVAPSPVLAPTAAPSSSTPHKNVARADNNVGVAPAVSTAGQFVKIVATSGEMEALAAKTGNGGRARQGFVPATYTGADRSDLNAQSQQMQSQQLHSQSQKVPAIDNPPPHPTAEALKRNASPVPQPASSIDRDLVVRAEDPAAQLGSPDRPPQAVAQAPVTQQHSDSTTYVSPSPALSAAAVTRMQSGYFHAHFGNLTSSNGGATTAATAVAAATVAHDAVDASASAFPNEQHQQRKQLQSPTLGGFLHPLLESSMSIRLGQETMRSQQHHSVAVAGHAGNREASGELDVLQRHSQLAQHEILSGGGGEHDEEGNANAPFVAAATIASDIAVEQAATSAPVRDAAAIGVDAAVFRAHERLRACIAELREAALPSSGSAPVHAAAEGAGLGEESGTAVEQQQQTLSAAIRESHHLTGILLELWNKAHNKST